MRCIAGASDGVEEAQAAVEEYVTQFTSEQMGQFQLLIAVFGPL